MKRMTDHARKFLDAHPELSAHTEWVADHFTRLDSAYFKRFDDSTIIRHIQAISELSEKSPVHLTVQTEQNRVTLTIISFDYPAFFSLLCGTLAAMGVNIESGQIHTYQPRADRPSPRGKPRIQNDRNTRRKKIIDRFIGVTREIPSESWKNELQSRVEGLIRHLEKDPQNGRHKARQTVDRQVADALADPVKAQRQLMPTEISVLAEGEKSARISVISEDTPFFLYALSSAISLRHLTILSVTIQTVNGRIHDEFQVAPMSSRIRLSPEYLERIKLSVLLTKEFTFFLHASPDPHEALTRFELLIENVLAGDFAKNWTRMLENPRSLEDLARLLGASRFLWEDFIRTHYEQLIPLLENRQRAVNRPAAPVDYHFRLIDALAGCTNAAAKEQVLNDFKDNESFRIELHHILEPSDDFHHFSQSLTRLADAVVCAAFEITFTELGKKHGRPKTVGGLAVKYAIFGLGKLGGEALGYASDMELLFVYSDQGNTDGPAPLHNSAFFEKLVKNAVLKIHAKQEGIFQVDLRLRPFGSDGPLASTLSAFCHYYAPSGSARAWERMALVRLRPIAGDTEFGRQIQRIKNDLVFSPKSIDLEEIRNLRRRQFLEKTGPLRNAKFDPGALVDIEYAIQILQITHGREHPRVRSPVIREALNALTVAGVLKEDESRRIKKAYQFLRRLINGLRMLRGNARDLFIPPKDSDEFTHLARRMGYGRCADHLSTREQLLSDFQTHTAIVRDFVERHIGQGSLPGPKIQNIADILINNDPHSPQAALVMARAGYQKPERAVSNFFKLKDMSGHPENFIQLAVFANEILVRLPDPDMTLNNWERFAAGAKSDHFLILMNQPKRLDIMLCLFSSSQFLSDILARQPALFNRVTRQKILDKEPQKSELTRSLSKRLKEFKGDTKILFQQFKEQETLRIGLRDLYLNASLESTTSALSDLADSLINAALTSAMQKHNVQKNEMCVLCAGKLGGRELNYSSDIDLLIFRGDAVQSPEKCTKAAEAFIKILSAYGTGHIYRVDMRLRPYGGSGELVPPFSQIAEYYLSAARGWEQQAMLKIRPVAGNLLMGQNFVDITHNGLLKKTDPLHIRKSIGDLREKTLLRLAGSAQRQKDIKTGPGGIRDIEFIIQGLQLIYAPKNPDILEANTINAINKLKNAGILCEKGAEKLYAHYRFLRRVEHFLQIYEDRQIHTLPSTPEGMRILAARMQMPDDNGKKFNSLLGNILGYNHERFQEFVQDRELNF